MSDGDRMDRDRQSRLRALEPGHLRAFVAFRRPRDESLDGQVVGSYATKGMEPGLNPLLARRVYDDEQGTIDLIPGPGVIYGAVTYAHGERLSTLMSIDWIPSASGFGFQAGDESATMAFMGVFAAGVREARIERTGAQPVRVSLNADDAYWISVQAATALVWIDGAGGRHRSETAHAARQGDSGLGPRGYG